MKITEARFDALIRAFATSFYRDGITVIKADSMMQTRKDDTVRVELAIRFSGKTCSLKESEEFIRQLSKVYRIVDDINDMNIILDEKEKDLLDEYDSESVEKSRGLRSTYIGIIQGAIESETHEWVLTNIICDKNGYEESRI